MDKTQLTTGHVCACKQDRGRQDGGKEQNKRDS